MYQAALSGGVWTYIPDSPYDISVAIRCDTLYPYAQSLERLQILDYLPFPLPVRQSPLYTTRHTLLRKYVPSINRLTASLLFIVH